MAGKVRKPKRFRKVNNNRNWGWGGLVVAGEFTIIVIKCSQIYKLYIVEIMVMERFFSRINKTLKDLPTVMRKETHVSLH